MYVFDSVSSVSAKPFQAAGRLQDVRRHAPSRLAKFAKSKQQCLAEHCRSLVRQFAVLCAKQAGCTAVTEQVNAAAARELGLSNISLLGGQHSGSGSAPGRCCAWRPAGVTIESELASRTPACHHQVRAYGAPTVRQSARPCA